MTFPMSDMNGNGTKVFIEDDVSFIIKIISHFLASIGNRVIFNDLECLVFEMFSIRNNE